MNKSGYRRNQIRTSDGRLIDDYIQVNNDKSITHLKYHDIHGTKRLVPILIQKGGQLTPIDFSKVPNGHLLENYATALARQMNLPLTKKEVKTPVLAEEKRAEEVVKDIAKEQPSNESKNKPTKKGKKEEKHVSFEDEQKPSTLHESDYPTNSKATRAQVLKAINDALTKDKPKKKLHGGLLKRII